MEVFSECFYNASGLPYENADAAFVLSYSGFFFSFFLFFSFLFFSFLFFSFLFFSILFFSFSFLFFSFLVQKLKNDNSYYAQCRCT